MVKVNIDEGIVTFDVQGLHKLWTFEGCVRVPITQIKDMRPDPTTLKGLLEGVAISRHSDSWPHCCGHLLPS